MQGMSVDERAEEALAACDTNISFKGRMITVERYFLMAVSKCPCFNKRARLFSIHARRCCASREILLHGKRGILLPDPILRRMQSIAIEFGLQDHRDRDTIIEF